MVAIAKAAENGGAAWLTVHGRTKAQMYKPPINWRAIGRAREAIGIPVVANGDLVDEASLAACTADSGCDAYMIGRGAMAHPDLFRRLRATASGSTATMSSADLGELLLEYVARTAASVAHDEKRREHKPLVMLKQWLRMGGAHREDLGGWFEVVKRTQTVGDAQAILRHAIRPAA